MKICSRIKEKLGIGIIKIREPIEDGFIIRSKDYELKKSDFNGQIRNGNTAELASKKLYEADVRITSIKENKIYHKIIEFKIIAIASRNDSWMNEQFVKLQDLGIILHHEQRHFMVEEAFAMKLRKKLKEDVKNEFSCARVKSEKPKITVEKEARKFLDNKRAECFYATVKYQKEYDDYVHDERRRQVPEKQREYDKKIAEMLKET